MRKYYFLFAATLLALISCQKENKNTEEDFSKKDLTIQASANGYSWKSGDAILVSCDGEAYNFTTEQSGETAAFTSTEGLTQEKVGINPLSAFFGCNQFGAFSIAQNQTIVGAESQTKLPMYAYTATAPEKAQVAMSFTPAASVLEVTLTPVNLTLNKVEFVPVDETSVVGCVAGQGTVNAVTGKVSYSGNLKSITATVQGGASLGSGLTFRLPVGWFSVTGGMKLVLTYNENNTYEELLWDDAPFQSYEGSGDAKAFKNIPVSVEMAVGARDYYVSPDGKASSKGIRESNPTTLDYALSSADAGSVIHLAAGTYNPERNLLGDTTGDVAHKTFEIARGLTLVGAGADKTILDAAGAFHVVCVTALPEGKVVLKDLTIKGGDNSEAEKADEDAGTGLVKSSVNQRNYLDNYGSGLYVIGSDIELEKVVLTANKGQNAVGGYILDAKASLKDVEANGNTSTGNGCGLWISASQATLDGCSFSNNDGAGVAAGLYVYSAKETTCTVSVSHSTISGNKTTGNEGGFYVRGADESAKVNATFTDCIIKDNEAVMGAGFGITYATVLMDGCQIVKNISSGNGANLVYPGAVTTVKDCIFRENTATLAAAIYEYTNAAAVELTVLNSEFSANTTAGRGGAIYTRAASTTGAVLNVANSTFFGNQAASTGSAIALYAAKDQPVQAKIYSSTFTGNICTRSSNTPGGAIGLETVNITADIYNCVVSGNVWEANAAGADVFKKAGTVTSHKSVIGSAVKDADGADVPNAPAFDAASMLTKKEADGKTTVFSLSGSNNPAKTYGYDVAGLKALGASFDAAVLEKDQWGNARNGSVMGSYVE